MDRTGRFLLGRDAQTSNTSAYIYIYIQMRDIFEKRDERVREREKKRIIIPARERKRIIIPARDPKQCVCVCEVYKQNV